MLEIYREKRMDIGRQRYTYVYIPMLERVYVYIQRDDTYILRDREKAYIG